MWKGVVVSLHTAPAAAEPMISLSEVRAVAGKGLEGDRYFTRVGTYSGRPGPGGAPSAREVTLIEVEAIDALTRDYAFQLKAGDSRRNIVTRGVPLNHLIGREFRVGEVVMKGIRLCEPCAHLEGLTQKGIMRGLIHRGGLRAEIVTGGVIRVGDSVEPQHEPV
ncbi:MAG: MOSC domain-containing protein [Candidatus Rokubacteria bacterium]|nr:MOSC domain-containing protein [Candidatus Rokubacteria bacterium]